MLFSALATTSGQWLVPLIVGVLAQIIIFDNSKEQLDRLIFEKISPEEGSTFIKDKESSAKSYLPWCIAALVSGGVSASLIYSGSYSAMMAMSYLGFIGSTVAAVKARVDSSVVSIFVKEARVKDNSSRYQEMARREQRAIATLKKKCSQFKPLLEKIDALTQNTREYPLDSNDRTLADVWAANQPRQKDKLTTLQWAHSRLEEIEKAKNKKQMAAKVLKDVVSENFGCNMFGPPRV
ncbi:MAG: hypothetical protein AB7I18_10955 [Candidatus Berkiella sp.]